MTRGRILPAWVVALAIAAPAPAQLPVFVGDPIDPGTSAPYVMLPGVPLVHPGPDEKYGSGDDMIDPNLVGDVDLVVRTGGGYAGGAIPAPHDGLASAPAVVAGGTATGAGVQVAVQGILSDGAPPAAAGNPLTGTELDGRPLLAIAYADLDGDGFIGPNGVDGDADEGVERQELLVPAGRQTASFAGGIATASLALSVGAPASVGGLGVVVGGGATTGSTPFLFFDGPWIGTLLPYMPPLDPDRIIGSNDIGGPVPSDLLVDFELEVQDDRTFSPAADHPVLGTPYAIPLDGSSPTVDLLRAEGGAAVGVACARPADPATFVASLARRLVPAVGPSSARTLYEAVEAVALASDGAGGAVAVDCFVVDRLGNATDPPAGGFAVTLEAGPRLRIATPDADGDPGREAITFTSAAAVTIEVDDTGLAATVPATDRVLALRAGVPVGMLPAELAVGPGGPGGGGAGSLGAGRTKLRFRKRPARGRVTVATTFDAAGISVDPSTQPLVLSLAAGGTGVFTRTIPAGALTANARGTAFRFRDPRTAAGPRIVRLVVRRVRGATFAVRLRLRVDLTGVSPATTSASLGVRVGAAQFAGGHACSANRRATVTTCVR
jgi:hypothetical protein